VKGSELALEGEAGFYNAFVGNNRGELSYVFAGPPRTSLSNVVAGLGSRWELMHVTPKIYPTAGYNCPVIELMTDLRARHAMPASQVQSITVDMNWLETTYPSPAFPNPARSRPGVASTHYFTAYTCVHGSYPPLRERIEPGERTSGEEPAVLDLLKRVEVVGHKDRPAFAPRITVRMRDGATHQGEYRGDELEWDLATETRRISALFGRMDWPRQKLDGLVQTVTHLEDEARIDPLMALCVRG
jgi:2-methylcitrate dehydratase PrpD